MRYYAEWLDGEYELLKHIIRGYKHSEVIERSVRLHALLGSTLNLSDSQMIDARTPLPEFFLDPGFMAFLKTKPNFLRLVADPVHGIRDEKFAIALKGLYRLTQQNGKDKDCFEKAGSKLFDVISRKSHFDIREYVGPNHVGRGGVGRVITRFPKFKRQLLGVLHSIEYFTSPPLTDTTMATRSRPEGYHKLLRKVQPEVGEQHAKRIEEIFRIHEKHLPEKQWGQRAAIRRVLGKGPWQDEPWKKADLRIYLDVVHAWNCAINQTIAPEAGTLYESDDDLPLSTFERVVTHTIDWFRPDRKLMSRLPEPLRRLLMWDPMKTDWNHIRVLVAETQETSDKLQAALRSGKNESWRNALKDHARKLGDLLSDYPVRTREVPEWGWKIAEIIAEREDVPSEGVQIASEALRSYPLMYASLRRRMVINTVTKAAAKLLPLPRGSST